MKELLILMVIRGHFAGCFGPVIDSRSIREPYEYLVQMTCIERSTDQVKQINEWFTSDYLDIKR